VAPARGRAQSTDRRLQQLQPLLAELSRQARELGLPADSVVEKLRTLLEAER
jgi:hypothetical protein